MPYHNLSELEYFLIRFFTSYVVFINSLYILIKSQDMKINKKRVIIVFVFNIFLSIIYAILNNNTTFAQTISFFGIALSFALLDNEKRTKFVLIGFISISFAHFIKTFSAILIGLIMWITNASINTSIPFYIQSAISLIITVLLIKIKRFKNGIQFFEKEDNLGLGLIISGIVFMLTTIDFNGVEKSIPLMVIVTFSIIIAGFGLYLWIKKSITKHYREKQQLKSELEYKKQLEQKQQEIEKLNHSNEYLAKIVHRDNHLMSSLDSSINAYFESGDRDFKDDILRKIQTLEIERAELINNEQRDSKILPSTGNALIDGAVNNLYIKAAAHGIDFDLSVSATVDEVIGKYISQTDLQTLICDHIKDAIIAVNAKNENNGKILVDFFMESDNYIITFFDSGVDFEIDTLAKLGKERVTTHADNGGSGIGFMTTFETLRKSYASLIITEFANKTPFSKSVSIRFDGNTAFIIQSYRKEEIQSNLNRNDIILL